jgi:anthranilate phosphoribosyltransferase
MPAHRLDDLGGWTAVLGTLADGRDLTAADTSAAMAEILAGNASDAQIAAFIIALRIKGETVDEVNGMVEAMLGASELLALNLDAVDIVGTGGSATRRLHALNVSTMASFVTAGAGVPVCKHGNRRASSTSGSFDLLEALGVEIELSGPAVARCVRESGVGFAFARAFHPAMRFAGPVRAELGIPTVFNLLGPLSHPSKIDRQVIGVGDARMQPLTAAVLASRGLPRSMVVHGSDGLDEITLTGTTEIHEIRDGEIVEWVLDPTGYGLPLRSTDDLRGGDPLANAEIARSVFAGERSPARDIVALNAAAGIYVGGAADSVGDGLEMAFASIDEGRAASTLEQLVALSLELATPAT